MLNAKEARNITENYKKDFYKHHFDLFYDVEQQIKIAAQKGYNSINIPRPDFSKELLMIFINLLKVEGYDYKLANNGERPDSIIISW